MRKGSLEFWPHRRAKKQMPRFRRFAAVSEETDLGGFVAFKVGMTHISMIDDSESPSKGSEVSRAVTILEMPRLIVYGLRLYKKGYIYRQAYTEYFDLEAAKRFGIESKKDVKALKSDSAFEDVMLLVFSDSSNLGFGNKRKMRFEIPVGGKDKNQKLSHALSIMGKELKAADIVKAGEYIDVKSITKGKGWAGVIKRYGVSTQVRKATGKVRHVGTLGPWHPPKVMFSVPHSGHMGYNFRTELNKRILMVGKASDAARINVSGGFPNYGLVSNDFLVVDGSIPGPAKRLVRVRKAIRSSGKIAEPQISYISVAAKNGA